MRTRWYRSLVVAGVVLGLVAMTSCGDDDGAVDPGADVTSTTAPPDDQTDPGTTDDNEEPNTTSSTPADDSPGEGTSNTLPGESAHSQDAIIDVEAGTVAGHPFGADADAVIADLEAALGPADHDTGWQATECPPAEAARTLTWGGLFVHFGNMGDATLDGVRVDLAVDADAAPYVVLPHGVEWGDPIDAVAEAVGAETVENEAFGWREVFTESFTAPVTFTSGPAQDFDHLMVGYVPVCR